MSKVPAQQLMQATRRDVQAVAVGPFTPLVYERYEYIGGERGWRLGYPIECGGGPGMCWSDRSQWPALRPVVTTPA